MNIKLLLDNMPFFLSAALVTLKIFLWVVVFTTAISMVVGSAATSRARGLRWVARTFIELFRDIPTIVGVFFVFFSAPVIHLQFDPAEATIVALSLWGGANGAEIVRGGINAVSRHQFESARSLGVSAMQIFICIITPQAVRPIIPAYAGLCTNLLQGTSLGALVGANELLKTAQIVIERAAYFEGGQPGLTVYAFVLCVFFVAGAVMTAGTRWLEKYLAVSASRN